MSAASAPAGAGDAALQSACYAPQALRALPGERFTHRDASFDATTSARALAPAATVPANLRGSIRRVELPPGEKLIALTFDLCERAGQVAGYDGAIFDYLRQEGVKATFFAGGKWLRSHAERAEQLMLDPLFEIANHSDSHRNLRIVDAPTMTSEILGPQRSYETARAQLSASQCVARSRRSLEGVEPRMRLFRFPFGACSPASLNAVNDAGLLAIQWDVSTGDPAPGVTAQAIAHALITKTRPGSILISHANGRGWKTAAALPLAIPKLKALGYQFVTVSELLARGKPVIADTCFNERPGDTNRYDFLFATRKPSPPKTAQVATALPTKPRNAAHAVAANRPRAVRTLSQSRRLPTKKL